MLAEKIIGRCKEVKLKGATPPERQREKSDKFVGELPDDLKRLFLVKLASAEKVQAANLRGQKFNQRVAALSQEERANPTAALLEESDKLKREIATAGTEHAFIEHLLSVEVRHHFPELMLERNVAICHDWSVVIEDSEKVERRQMSADFEYFLDRIFSSREE